MMEQSSLEWKKFSTEDLEIMLPGTFIGGHPKKDKKAIEAAIALTPEKYRPVCSSFFKGSSSPFMAIDSVMDDSYLYCTTVATAVDKIPFLEFGWNMERYLKESLKRLGRNVEVAEQGIVSLQNYQAARVVLYDRKKQGIFKKPGEVLRTVVFYSIKLKNRFWDFFYSTMPVRYEKELPIFEQSIHSVLIKID